MSNVYIEYLGNSIEMPVGETIIGRDIKCGLRFNDPAVSRRHLRLIRREQEALVEDLGSSNGTSLNGKKLVATLRLKDGDSIRFGSREIVIRIADEECDQHPTLLIAGQALDDAQPLVSPLRMNSFVELDAKPFPKRTRTQPMPTVNPIEPFAHQRCPRCAAPVTEVEDECPSCRYDWGSFRAMSRTDVRPVVSRRRHERHAIELHLVYVSPTLEIEASTRDLSESGVFVCSQVLDPVGTRCHLTMLIDGGPPLSLDGVVRRVVEHVGDEQASGLGVEFVQVGEMDLAWIRAAGADGPEALDP